MHEMRTIDTDVHCVCQSVTRLKSVAVRAVYTACCVCEVIWCSLCLIPGAARSGPKARPAAAIVKSRMCAYYLYVLSVVAAAD